VVGVCELLVLQVLHMLQMVDELLLTQQELDRILELPLGLGRLLGLLLRLLLGLLLGLLRLPLRWLLLLLLRLLLPLLPSPCTVLGSWLPLGASWDLLMKKNTRCQAP